MDNMCVFFNWAVKEDFRVEKLSSGMAKVTITAHAPRPNKAGIWNKNYFTAFDDVADRFVKCNIKAPFYITITAEQNVYKDKEGKIKNSYIIKDFQLLPKLANTGGVETKATENKPVANNPTPPTPAVQKQEVQSDCVPNTQEPTPVPDVPAVNTTSIPTVSSSNTLFGLSALEEFMK